MKKRVLFIIAIFFAMFILAAVVFFMIPETVLKFESEDGEYTVRITQERKEMFGVGPKHEYDYRLIVTKERFLFDKVIYDEDFVFKTDGAGIDESCLSIEWTSWRIRVVIDDPHSPLIKTICLTEDGSDLDIDTVYDWSRLCDICSGQAFLSLNENEQKEVLDKAIAKIQATYQFESYEYDIKQKPIVVSLHYPDGRTEAVQLQPSNPLEN